MLTFKRPDGSFLAFLAAIVLIGTLIGHAVNALGISVFLLFIQSIDPKPAWRFFWDPPRPQIGRWCWGGWGRRVIPVRPDDQTRLPRTKW